jgi:hypothetical protein
MSWLTDPTANPGSRNAGIGSARLPRSAFARYEDRWDLLEAPAFEVPVMLDARMRDAIDDPLVGLPEGHRWRDGVPEFSPVEHSA